jgi:hypothetical protein
MRVWCGAVAQLGERLVRNEEVSGSIPLSSTKEFNESPAEHCRVRHFCLIFALVIGREVVRLTMLAMELVGVT